MMFGDDFSEGRFSYYRQKENNMNSSYYFDLTITDDDISSEAKSLDLDSYFNDFLKIVDNYQKISLNSYSYYYNLENLVRKYDSMMVDLDNRMYSSPLKKLIPKCLRKKLYDKQFWNQLYLNFDNNVIDDLYIKIKID
jgi:hypothetical protein